MKITPPNAKLLSEYRTELMGLAAIGVLIVHSAGWIPWPGFTQQLISYGGVGVFFSLFFPV